MSLSSPNSTASSEPVTDAERGSFVESALSRHAQRDGLVVVRVPAPVVDPDTALRVLWDEASPTVLWHPPGGVAAVGCGAAHRIDAEGPERMACLRRDADALWKTLAVETHPSVQAGPPRLYGGMAFAPASGSVDDAWRELGDVAFVLPRWTWERDGDRAWWSFAARAYGMDAEARRGVVDELRRLEGALQQQARDGTRRESSAGEVRRVASLERDWDADVRAASDAIAAGRLTKVVLARAADVEHARAIDPRDVLARLGRDQADCTRFAFRPASTTFVGATPERLLATRGVEVETEAVAGSAVRGASRRLLSSRKDRREHDYVIDALVERLAPLCVHVERAPEPRVRELRDVLHLHTPVHGRLDGGVHALDVADALHPTPAVAGLPGDAAMRWIAAHEPVSRGWYGGPVGWIDARGDGALAVALRSGLIDGRRARVWAGAGLVKGSRPQAEHAETELKMRAVLDALGVDGSARPVHPDVRGREDTG